MSCTWHVLLDHGVGSGVVGWYAVWSVWRRGSNDIPDYTIWEDVAHLCEHNICLTKDCSNSQIRHDEMICFPCVDL